MSDSTGGRPVADWQGQSPVQDDLAATMKRPRIIPPPMTGDAATHPLDVTTIRSNGSHTSETAALVEKSIRGTQWIMLAIVIGVPLGFLTNVVMYRLSPAALGIYSLMLLLVTTVQTFFLFGGSNVVVNFIPRASAREKSAFMLSYLGLALIFALVFFAVVLIRPDLLQFLLLGNPVDARVYLFLLGFIPLVIAQTLTIAILQGEMELGAAARTQYGVQTAGFALAIVMVYVVVRQHLLPDLAGAAVIVPGAYLVSLLSGGYALIKVMRRRWRFNLQMHFPPGFWTFTTTFHLNTVVAFFFNNIDQIFILFYYGGLTGVTQNGDYRAALVIATYALWAPNLFTGAMYPFFTNLVARGDFTMLRNAYRRYSAITGVVVAAMGMIFGLFAPQIVLIYGSKGGHSAPLGLIEIFAVMYAILASAAYVPTTALITAREAIWINLLLNIMAFAVRFALYDVLIGPYGLVGIAIANAISLGVLYYGTLIIAGLRYHVSVPARQHLVSVAATILLLGSYALAPHLSLLLSLGERIAALALFILIVAQLRLVSQQDLARVTQRLPFLKKLARAH